eukprot:3198782-Pleurochrysis_carterae.AAC.1
MVRDVIRIIRKFDVDHVVENACAFDIAHARCFRDLEATGFKGGAECGACLTLHALEVKADDKGEPE